MPSVDAIRCNNEGHTYTVAHPPTVDTVTLPYILVAEDDAAAVLLLEMAAEEAGLRCALEIVNDGPTLIRTLVGDDRPRRRAPVVVLLDLNLPGQSGKEVLKTLRATDALATLPIVVMSGSERPDEIAECLRLGANSFVVKPVGVAPLITTLQALETYWLDTVAQPTEWLS